MDGKFLARVGAGVFVAIAVTATAVEITRENAPADSAPARQPVMHDDPLRADLVRCQELGEAGPRDHDCLRAWAENRRRFLAPGARPSGRIAPTAPASGGEAANP